MYMDIRFINAENRQQVNEFIRSSWFSTDIIIRGEVVDTTVLEGIAVYDKEELLGLLTFRIKDKELEIVSLDSIQENQGIGSALMNRIKEEAVKRNCNKIKLITTNDNLNALMFYQKRGYDMVQVYPNALDLSRRLKPTIPLTGNYGIPLKHEIEFELVL